MSPQYIQILLAILSVFPATAFVPFIGQRAFHPPLRAQSQNVDGVDDAVLQQLRSMSVADIKKELTSLKTPFNDLFEKEGLIRRLHDTRSQTSETRTQQPPIDSSKSKSTRDVLQAPLYFTSLDSGVRVAAVNVEDGGVTIQSGGQPYPTIKIDVPEPSGRGSFTLTLLLDTACSGFVLRPNIVTKYNLPSYSTPVTMTGAGGTSGATGLTQLETFSLAGTTFGPLPAAVQDIGALPRELDGIVGLSFLSQFAGIEMDFRRGVVSFFRDSNSLNDDSKTKTVLAEADMELAGSLGIYTVDVLLGGRGPVKMLVDSGAASSFLNWKGVADLGLDRKSPAIAPISSMGAMGSDNMAIQLTHRIGVSSTLNLGRSSYPGLSLKDARLPIDIGQIPVLDSVQGAGGILGIDALMRCATVRLTFKGRPRLTFLS
jgi:predicted aspartyl protease